MFGFLKKKNKEGDERELKIKGGGETDEALKRKRKVKDEGSRWAAVVVLGVSVLMALGFWVYGRLGGDYEVTGKSLFNSQSGGKIIFEKRNLGIQEDKNSRIDEEKMEKDFESEDVVDEEMAF